MTEENQDNESENVSIEELESEEIDTSDLEVNEDNLDEEIKYSKENLNKIAFKLSRTFRFIELQESDHQKSDDHYIHEYLRINFPKIADKLISRRVIKRAMYYSRKSFKPEVIKIVNELDIDDFTFTKVLLNREVVLINEPIPFQSAVILSRRELKDELLPILGDPYDVFGYEVGCDVAYVHWSFLGWVKYNQPAILIEHAFGRNEMLMRAISEASKIDKAIKDLMLKIINDMESKETSVDKRIDRALREADHYQKLFDHSWKQMKTEREKNVQKDLSNLRQQRKEMYEGSSRTSIVITIVIIISLTILGIWFVYNSAFAPPTNSTNNETTGEGNKTKSLNLLFILIQLFLVIL
ncbi:MAG: hypothetical protein ACFFG0_41135 [Candidatus Thorarchaeota archaeon]